MADPETLPAASPDWEALGEEVERQRYVGDTSMWKLRGDGWTILACPVFVGNKRTGEWEVEVHAIEDGWRVRRVRRALNESEAREWATALVLLHHGLLPGSEQ